MPATINRLELLTVRVPCTVAWDSMVGDLQVRFCGQCRLHVYNLSEMDRDEAEALLEAKEGRTCVRFYRRPDGTVLTRDCQRKAGVLRRLCAMGIGAAAALILLILGSLGLLLAGTGSPQKQVRLRAREVEPFRTVLNWLMPEPTPPTQNPPMNPSEMGVVVPVPISQPGGP